jgi:glutamine amidotransferase
MIAIIDTGIGNVGSISKMVREAGGECIVTRKPSEVLAAGKIVLPGVGAFDAGMKQLVECGLAEALLERMNDGDAVLLGICLGMQMLVEGSEEGNSAGLGLIPGVCRGLRPTADSEVLRVPHIGWNTVALRVATPLLDKLGERPRFYFLHSYYVETAPEHVVGVTEYGGSFASIIQRGRIFGVQFHPEKSHRFGLALFRNFVRLT